MLISKIDPLNYLLNKTTLMSRLAKWVMILSEFEIKHVNRKEIKGQNICDQLVDVPIETSNTILVDFLDMHILESSSYYPQN